MESEMKKELGLTTDVMGQILTRIECHDWEHLILTFANDKQLIIYACNCCQGPHIVESVNLDGH